MSAKTWLITGTSRGFGREWAEAALERGDAVAATARDAGTLDDLVEKHGDAVLPISLDVNDREADFAAVAQAHEHFGRLDIVVNNAGYGQFGMVEELSESQARDQIETNCSARSGSPRPRCRSCAPRAAATSSRSPRSAGSPHSRRSASTTRRSGPSRASANRSLRRSPAQPVSVEAHGGQE